MIIIICPRCSTNNPIGATTCGRCGIPLSDYMPNFDYRPTSRTQKKNGNGVIIAAIITTIIILLVVFGILLYLLLKPAPTPTLQTSPIANMSDIALSAANVVSANANTAALNTLIDTNNPTVTQSVPSTQTQVVYVPSPVYHYPVEYTCRPERKPKYRPEHEYHTPPSNDYHEDPEPNYINLQNQYYSKAQQIDNYASNNLDTATTQKDKNLEARVTFEKWDVLLNEVYSHLKSSMSSSEFSTLDKEESNWIRSKENAISGAVAQHEGTSKETEAKYTTGIDYTRDRCYYLISLVD